MQDMSGLSVPGSLEFTRFTSLPLRKAASSITLLSASEE